jgi:hypothetical protein
MAVPATSAFDLADAHSPRLPEDVPGQTRIVFAITSAGLDLFSAMTRLAIGSLRITNPASHITVVCDEMSDGAMRRAKDPLLKEADEWLVADSPVGSAVFRNRFVKTRLRHLVDGPFLFLDSDILVRCDLSELFTIREDVGAARNHSRREREGQVGPQDLEVLKALRWRTRDDLYVNGGVLFYADSPAAHALAAEWHRLWQISHSQCGEYRDQPALNAALADTRVSLAVLPDRFNAQFWGNPSAAVNACIWHFYSSDKGVPTTPFESVVETLRDGRPLLTSQVAALIDSEFPWDTRRIFDRFVVKRITRRHLFHGWEAAWLRGSLRDHLYAEAARRFRSVGRR